MPQYTRVFYQCDRCSKEVESRSLPVNWAVFAAFGARGALKYGQEYDTMRADKQAVLCPDCAQGLREFLEKL